MPGAPPGCSEAAFCEAHEECYQGLLGTRLLGFGTAGEAEAAALAAPGTVDAVIELWGPAMGLSREQGWEQRGERSGERGPLQEQAQARRVAGGGSSSHLQQQQRSGSGDEGGGSDASSAALGALSSSSSSPHAYSYTLRLNHTSVPFTRMLYNSFDLAPGKQYRSYWWFLNLQYLLDQAILSLAAAGEPQRGACMNACMHLVSIWALRDLPAGRAAGGLRVCSGWPGGGSRLRTFNPAHCTLQLPRLNQPLLTATPAPARHCRQRHQHIWHPPPAAAPGALPQALPLAR